MLQIKCLCCSKDKEYKIRFLSDSKIHGLLRRICFSCIIRYCAMCFGYSMFIMGNL